MKPLYKKTINLLHAYLYTLTFAEVLAGVLLVLLTEEWSANFRVGLALLVAALITGLCAHILDDKRVQVSLFDEDV